MILSTDKNTISTWKLETVQFWFSSDKGCFAEDHKVEMCQRAKKSVCDKKDTTSIVNVVHLSARPEELEPAHSSEDLHDTIDPLPHSAANRGCWSVGMFGRSLLSPPTCPNRPTGVLHAPTCPNCPVGGPDHPMSNEQRIKHSQMRPL